MAAQKNLDDQLETAAELLSEGKLDEARAILEAALVTDPEEPAIHVLLAQVGATTGDFEAAQEGYEKALALDPEYFEALYGLAQLVAAEGVLDEAERIAGKAMDAAEEEDEFVDAILLRTEILLGLDDDEAAVETLESLPDGIDLPDPEQHLRAGGCFYELEDFENATAHYAAAAKLLPEDADAHHGVGLCADAVGDLPARDAAWARVRKIDLAQEAPPWSITTDALEKEVDTVIGELPHRMKALLANVPVVVDDYPSETLVKDGVDPRLLGLFDGTPFPEQGMGAAPSLQQIFLFRRNIERDAHHAEEVRQEIRVTLLHEAGHFFGLDEDDLAALNLD